MEINWFTFFAQIVNFSILVYVLQRLLYKPVIKAMEQREKTIRDRLESAEQKKQEAKQENIHYQEMQAKFADQQAELLATAKLEVEQTRQRLFQEVEDESTSERSEWKASLQRQKSTFLQELRHRTVQQLQISLRLVLKDLAETTLEYQIAKAFLKKLRNLSEDAIAVLVSTLTKQSEDGNAITLTVVSAFSLPEEIRVEIGNVLQHYFKQADLGSLPLGYETQSDLICGVELRGAGYKLTWSIDSYLDNLTENLDSVLSEEIKVEVSQKTNINKTHG
jgi:F-type H+-transporting ATPase subunit b